MQGQDSNYTYNIENGLCAANPQKVVSVMSAYNKLKQVQFRLTATQNRIQAMLLRSQKQQKHKQVMQKQTEQQALIHRQTLHERKIRTQNSVGIKMKELERREVLNQERRQMIKRLEQKQGERRMKNKDGYLFAKRMHQRGDRLIQKRKQQCLKQKKQRRDKVRDGEQKGKQKVKAYLQHSLTTTKSKNKKQVRIALHHIENKKKMISHLERICRSQSYWRNASTIDENPEREKLNKNNHFRKRKRPISVTKNQRFASLPTKVFQSGSAESIMTQ